MRVDEKSMEDMQDSVRSKPFTPVVVAPSFNNAGTLAGIVKRVRALDLPLIVVNDGSTDETAAILRGLVAADDGVTVVTHPRNRGKAEALASGFAAAGEAGFTHAVTIDTDGQLDPEQVPSLLSLARRSPHGLVIGQRDENTEGYPSRSRIGRRVSNLFVWMQSGVRVEDSQCGFRVYPLEFLHEVRCSAGRYGFETEVITRAAWAGRPVLGVPVRCRYFPAGKAVSHFRPFVDSFRGVPMHLRLMLRALSPVGRRDERRSIRSEISNLKSQLSNREEGTNPLPSIRNLLRRFGRWLNPMPAIRQLREDDVGRVNAAAGLAVGAFIANLPAYGLQTVLSLYAARKLHLHPLSVVIGSHLSTPPVGPVLVAAAVTIGHLVLHAELPNLASYDVRVIGVLPLLRACFLEWALGSLVTGLFSAWVTYLAARRLLRLAARGPETTPVAASA
jgi:glycosyltransferase involved in cell wall biosynthesis